MYQFQRKNKARKAAAEADITAQKGKTSKLANLKGLKSSISNSTNTLISKIKPTIKKRKSITDTINIPQLNTTSDKSEALDKTTSKEEFSEQQLSDLFNASNESLAPATPPEPIPEPTINEEPLDDIALDNMSLDENLIEEDFNIHENNDFEPEVEHALTNELVEPIASPAVTSISTPTTTPNSTPSINTPNNQINTIVDKPQENKNLSTQNLPPRNSNPNKKPRKPPKFIRNQMPKPEKKTRSAKKLERRQKRINRNQSYKENNNDKTTQLNYTPILSKQQSLILGSFLFFVGLGMCFAFISFYNSWKDDLSEITQIFESDIVLKNKISRMGVITSYVFVYLGFGLSALWIPFLTMFTGVCLFLEIRRKPIVEYWIWGIYLMLWCSLFFGIFEQKQSLLSGIVGYELHELISSVIGWMGVVLVLLFLAVLYGILRLGYTPETFANDIVNLKNRVFNIFRRDIMEAFDKEYIMEDEDLESDNNDNIQQHKTSSQEIQKINQEVDLQEKLIEDNNQITQQNDVVIPDTPSIGVPLPLDIQTLKRSLKIQADEEIEEDYSIMEEIPKPLEDENEFIDTINNSTEQKTQEEKKKDEETKKEELLENAISKQIPLETPQPKKTKNKIVKEPSLEVEIPKEEETPIDKSKTTEKPKSSEQLVADFGEFNPKLELSNYQIPSIDLLKDYDSKEAGITIDQFELEENKNRIVETLRNYKIEISQIKATVGPTVTLYEIIPQAGIRISKIKNLEDDIALSLAALGIRIIAPIPGKGTIGIEVPNKRSSIVSMRSTIASKVFIESEMELPLALGKTISNETFVVDLAKMPHLLMAGATGQGKSVGLNAILTSLLYKKHPAEIKFVLVDPKKVELTLYNKIERHYLAKLPETEEAIITDNNQVIHTLNSLCIEMDKRYDLLKKAMVRNLKEYNKKFKQRKLNPDNGHRFLPYIVLVIDEFADLIMTAGKEVETPIARLAQLARAIGIHLIIATQRPSVNVITGMIKANFPARIAFRVTSKIDSRTILDSGGADQLIGRGDMLYTQGNDLTRIQCAFVDTPEVEEITDFIGNQKAYPNAYELPEYEALESGTNVDTKILDRDKLFKEAAEVLVTAQQGSASLLQRKLKLGYNRAGRLIDQLEQAGIVGPFEGSKARQVLISDLTELYNLLDQE